MTRPSQISLQRFLWIQALVVACFGTAFALGTGRNSPSLTAQLVGNRTTSEVPVPRQLPLRIPSLYNAPEMISDAELAAVLKQVRPKFAPEHLKPNFVEHALRIWGIDATFADQDVMSGEQLKDFLVNHGHYMASWGAEHPPLLIEDGEAVRIRWGKQDGSSVHHDHWLASLTEAGTPLNEPVFTPSQHQKTLGGVLQQALRDFRLDEREVEWSVMAFGLWLAPIESWTTSDGREVSFNLLAERLIRGADHVGVCHGTHRLYSLIVLVRLDDEFHILSSEVRHEIFAHLRHVRELLIASQFPDGHWPSNWDEGTAAVNHPADDPIFRQVISTGHHLEWLALAPEELHPPREMIHKAVRWAIRTTVEQPLDSILERYTFFSHVGGALALWRQTRASDFWRVWEASQNDPKGI